jgi:hypothetical protein
MNERLLVDATTVARLRDTSNALHRKLRDARVPNPYDFIADNYADGIDAALRALKLEGGEP